jgi:hypothetical protein
MAGKIKGRGTRAGLKQRLHRGRCGTATARTRAAPFYNRLKRLKFLGAMLARLRPGLMELGSSEQGI